MKESKKNQIIKIANTMPFLPNLSFNIPQFRKLFKQAKQFYKREWRGKEKQSPAFGGRIVEATNYGWNHVLGKRITTNYRDAIKRLNHLPNAKQILEKTDFIYETTKEVDKQNKVVNRHSILGKLENGIILRVVVKEVDNRLIFVTIYATAKIKKDSKETHERHGSE